ncbi:hypothetical protein CDD83_2643 [Cordyceps sp. RAO-2017]|nr:hypothetical protein CDD83_2643 [Cordyceps sp. RAO-2017]
MAQQQRAPPAFDFEIDDSLAEWAVPAPAWLARNAERLRLRKLALDGIASGSLVFDPAGRVLMLQRADHDSMPGRWEMPGGAVDDADPTILHGAARELWEEAGLVATRFCAVVTEGSSGRDLQVYPNRNRTRWFCRFAFLAQVESCHDVRLDPNEHQAFVWASEDDVRRQSVDRHPLPVTTDAVRLLILESFRLRRELDEARPS